MIYTLPAEIEESGIKKLSVDDIRNKILHGNCYEVLDTLPDECFQVCINSPPYHGLRAYHTEPQIWGGDKDCEHEWEDATYVRRSSDGGSEDRIQTGNEGSLGRDEPVENAFCKRCGAWRGELGLEPTPELFILHLVMIYRKVRRVVRKDGMCFIVIGDSYTAQSSHKGGTQYDKFRDDKNWSERSKARESVGNSDKPKDLVGVPHMLSLALKKPWMECLTCHKEFHATQFGTFIDARGTPHYVCPHCQKVVMVKITEKGWYWRGDICFSKVNSMPESVTDRPTRSHETIIMLSKSQKYFYDRFGFREPLSESYLKDARPPGVLRQRFYDNSKYNLFSYGSEQFSPEANARVKEKIEKQNALGKQTYKGFNERCRDKKIRKHDSENDQRIAGSSKPMAGHSGYYDENGNLLVDPDEGRNMRDVWHLVVSGTKEAHFAVYSENVVERPLLVATSEMGCCSKCGAPIARVVEKDKDSESKTVRWEPTCKCEGSSKVPCLTLDLFFGSGTTGYVSKKYGRDFTGIELNPDNIEIAERRIASVMNRQLGEWGSNGTSDEIEA